MDAAVPCDFLPLAHLMIRALGPAITPDRAFPSVITACNGSARDTVSALVRLVMLVQLRGVQTV